MIVGFAWYSFLFKDKWMKLAGIKPKANSNPPLTPLIVMFIGTLITAYLLARFMFYTGDVGAYGGVKTAFLAWLGFMAPVVASGMFTNKPKALMAIDAGHYLASALAMGIVLGIVG